MSPQQLGQIAALAGQFGNGQVEITARGNLQVRGLETPQVSRFAAAVESVIPIESGTPIEISPLAGLDPNEIGDARDVAEGIRAALAGSAVADRLGPKVTVVVDGGDAWDRRRLAADIRLTAVGGDTWRLEIGGRAIGLLSERDAAEAVLVGLAMIAEVDGRGRDVDPAAARQRLQGVLRADAAPDERATALDPIVRLTDGRSAGAVWLPFGAVRAGVLAEMAEAAARLGVLEFRLAPHHGLLAICASGAVATDYHGVAAGLGLVVSANDPRRAISACIGSDGCASGTIAARRVAEALVQREPALFDGSFEAHVSGCSKGCAHPGPALLTLVGNEAGLDVVIEGSARGLPVLHLENEAVPASMERLAALWRDERALGESAGACFKRLGAASIAAAIRQGLQ
jgi:precorrin-3B synthase